MNNTIEAIAWAFNYLGLYSLGVITFYEFGPGTRRSENRINKLLKIKADEVVEILSKNLPEIQVTEVHIDVMENDNKSTSEWGATTNSDKCDTIKKTARKKRGEKNAD